MLLLQCTRSTFSFFSELGLYIETNGSVTYCTNFFLGCLVVVIVNIFLPFKVVVFDNWAQFICS